MTGDFVLVRRHRRNKTMSRFHTHPHKVVNVTGSDITVVSKDKGFLTRNKSFFKKLKNKPIQLEEEDDEEEEEEVDRRPDSVEVDCQPDSVREEIGTNGVELRRSNRVRNFPNRYGNPIPSEIISRFI